MTAQIQVQGFRCQRCFHEWVPRYDKAPKVCPQCKRTNWETPAGRSNASELKGREEVSA